MKIYLAGRFSRIEELNRYADELETVGIKVTSRWLRGSHEWVGTPDERIPAERLARFASEDLADIDAADVLVCFTEPPRTAPARGGRHIEAGYAIARGMSVIVVGPVENVFYALPQLFRFETWEPAFHLLVNATAAMAGGLRAEVHHG